MPESDARSVELTVSQRTGRCPKRSTSLITVCLKSCPTRSTSMITVCLKSCQTRSTSLIIVCLKSCQTRSTSLITVCLKSCPTRSISLITVCLKSCPTCSTSLITVCLKPCPTRSTSLITVCPESGGDRQPTDRPLSSTCRFLHRWSVPPALALAVCLASRLALNAIHCGNGTVWRWCHSLWKRNSLDTARPGG